MPITDAYYAFPIDRQMYPVFKGKKHEHWTEAARRHGFTLVGRAVDHLHVVLECKTCGDATLKRISVILGHNPECGNCIRKRREAAAGKVGATLLGPDPEGDRHYGAYQFACGHVDRRQHLRVEDAAAGGHDLSCDICTNELHASEAKTHGWKLIGPAARNNQSYREYEHGRGHDRVEGRTTRLSRSLIVGAISWSTGQWQNASSISACRIFAGPIDRNELLL